MANRRLLQGEAEIINTAMPANQLNNVGTVIKNILDNGETFQATATLTSAAAGTAIVLFDDSLIGLGRQAYVQGFRFFVNGGTAWTDSTATKVSIIDNASSPLVVVDIAKAGLTGNAVIEQPNTNATLGTNMKSGLGYTVNKGLSVKADANFAAGNNLIVTVYGLLK